MSTIDNLMAHPPAIPRRWYCNKCGHLGETGPEHDICAGVPLTRCQYSAVPHGPYWSDEQVRAALAEALDMGEPVAWRAEWRGDDSDLNSHILIEDMSDMDDRPLDQWQPLYVAKDAK